MHSRYLLSNGLVVAFPAFPACVQYPVIFDRDIQRVCIIDIRMNDFILIIKRQSAETIITLKYGQDKVDDDNHYSINS